MAIVTRQDSRKGTLYLYKRVPKRYAAVEDREFVWVSLHTDSMTVARAKEGAAWDHLVAGWEARLAGDTADANQRFQAARDLAEAKGFRYLGVEQVSQLPLPELRDRFTAITGFADGRSKPDMGEAAALLGAMKPPGLTVSQALELHWTFAKDKTLGKSDDQVRRWKNPLIKAVNNFIAVIGDKQLAQITRDDMLDFRNWWMERLEEEELTPNSANKDLIHLGAVLNMVNEKKRLGLVLPLGGLSFQEGDAKTRPPFSTKWIREKLLAEGALDGLNSEARAILLVMINTGCRPSELAALTKKTIRLDQNVPHISIEPEGRQIKSKHARRTIPVMGVSLEALRAFPEGFPRYLHSSASLSATVNKFLRENGLMETEQHTLYSLRHAFEDRMLAAGIDDRIRRDLFGHRLDRERYGAGATLEMKQEVLQAACL